MYRKTILTLILGLCGILCYADDDGRLLEKDEPIKFVIGDGMHSPSADVYDDWNNYSVHTRVMDIPEEYEINLDGYHHPLHNETELLSPFGRRIARNHNGVDIRAEVTDTVYSAFDGKVRYAAYNAGGYGNLVVVRHYNGLETYYSHLSKIGVRQNEYVNAGQPLGIAGRTGRATCVHLHFETRFCGIPINPENLINLKKKDTIYDTYKFVRGKKR